LPTTTTPFLCITGLVWLNAQRRACRSCSVHRYHTISMFLNVGHRDLRANIAEQEDAYNCLFPRTCFAVEPESACGEQLAHSDGDHHGRDNIRTAPRTSLA